MDIIEEYHTVNQAPKHEYLHCFSVASHVVLHFRLWRQYGGENTDPEILECKYMETRRNTRLGDIRR